MGPTKCHGNPLIFLTFVGELMLGTGGFPQLRALRTHRKKVTKEDNHA